MGNEGAKLPRDRGDGCCNRYPRRDTPPKGKFKFVEESNTCTGSRDKVQKNATRRDITVHCCWPRGWKAGGRGADPPPPKEQRGTSRGKRRKKSENLDSQGPLSERQKDLEQKYVGKALEHELKGGKRPSKQFYSGFAFECFSLRFRLLPAVRG